MAEYTPVIYSSNSLPCVPKKEEFLHFIFVLTYAEVHGGLDPNHRWTRPTSNVECNNGSVCGLQMVGAYYGHITTYIDTRKHLLLTTVAHLLHSVAKSTKQFIFKIKGGLCMSLIFSMLYRT